MDLCRPSDYFESTIQHKGKAICQIDGTYCGYINFDKVRYWDGRFLKAFKVELPSTQIQLDENTLESDYRKRNDLQLLKQGKMEEAQKAKEEIEEKQRRDAKLRDKFAPKK